jgi:hypothetical protein
MIQASKGTDMAYPVTADGMKDFLNYLSSKGLINPNTVGGIRSACDKIFSALDQDECNNLAEIDVDHAVTRFMNKNPNVLSPESATVYKSRVSKAIKLLVDFNANPAGFRVQSPKKMNGNGGEKKPVAESKLTKNLTANVTQRSQSSEAGKVNADEDKHQHQNSVSLSFPIRPDFMAQFILPKDMTTKEAKKLAAYFEVLAIDFEPS